MQRPPRDDQVKRYPTEKLGFTMYRESIGAVKCEQECDVQKIERTAFLIPAQYCCSSDFYSPLHAVAGKTPHLESIQFDNSLVPFRIAFFQFQ